MKTLLSESNAMTLYHNLVLQEGRRKERKRGTGADGTSGETIKCPHTDYRQLRLDRLRLWVTLSIPFTAQAQPLPAGLRVEG
jgi:hypothetical protein